MEDSLKSHIDSGPSELRSVTYFDIMPTDVCPEIIKWLNRVCRIAVTNMQSTYTPPEKNDSTRFLSLIFSKKSPFRDVVSSMFSKIHLAVTYGQIEVNVDDGHIIVGPELFDGEALETGLASLILEICGATARKISISTGLDGPNEELVGNKFIELFTSLVIEHCQNVEQLEYDGTSPCSDIGTSLYTAYFSQIRSIEWYVYDADDYSRLPDFGVCTDIRHLILVATPQLVSVLQSCGTSLETLDISFDSGMEGCVEVVDAIELNCRKLKDIFIRRSEDVIPVIGEERYASFLCSYGAQLISAQVYGLSTEKMLEVRRKCSNLLITSLLAMADGINDWERISLFGPNLELLIVDMDSCTEEGYSSAIAKCTKLSTLIIHDTVSQQEYDGNPVLNILSSLSSSPLMCLLFWDFRPTQQNISMIATASSNLRHLRLTTKGPMNHGISFRAIADSNPNLHTVHIREDVDFDGERDPDFAEELLRMLVDTFSKCRSISFGILDTDERPIDQDTVRDICGFLPCRGVDVEIQIGSTYYRQIGHSL